MRTKAEIRLLMARQRIRDAMLQLKAAPVVDLETYRLLEAKFNAVQHYILKIRRKELKVKKSAM